MDLMRTLLIYMSATMALAVQNTAAPQVTPVPSPAPNAVVETVALPGPGEEGKITAAPPEQTGEAKNTAKITPLPVPTITPNMKGYHNLAMGAKGKEVRKLQEKLIEMGYLAEGSADGAYGRKTFNAVKKFQYYNGLTADGIAGRKTQTNLFENPDAAPNPEVTPAPETPAPAIATPDVTDTPEAEEPKAAEPEAAAEETGEPEAGETETETPEADVPETDTAEAEEAPEAETAETGEAGTENQTAEAPEATRAPGAGIKKADNTGKSEEEAPEVVENVDLDADVYEQITASVALNAGDGPLEYIVNRDGMPMAVKPRVSQNGARIRVSLDDLCKCVDTWKLTDDGAGSVVLEAAGYTLVLYNEVKGCSATLDGTAIPVKSDDVDFVSEGHFINAEFLATALKGSAAWDQEESTLMLRIRDKEAVESKD